MLLLQSEGHRIKTFLPENEKIDYVDENEKECKKIELTNKRSDISVFEKNHYERLFLELNYIKNNTLENCILITLSQILIYLNKYQDIRDKYTKKNYWWSKSKLINLLRKLITIHHMYVDRNELILYIIDLIINKPEYLKKYNHYDCHNENGISMTSHYFYFQDKIRKELLEKYSKDNYSIVRLGPIIQPIIALPVGLLYIPDYLLHEAKRHLINPFLYDNSFLLLELIEFKNEIEELVNLKLNKV